MELDFGSQVFGGPAFHEFLETELDTELDKLYEKDPSNIYRKDLV